MYCAKIWPPDPNRSPPLGRKLQEIAVYPKTKGNKSIFC